jgi:copper oxidase (laccase) domain-containing protein
MKYFEYPISDNVIALTTTRKVGNMAFHLHDNYDAVFQRRNEVTADLKIELPHLIFTHQTHSDVIQEVTRRDIGKVPLPSKKASKETPYTQRKED